MQEQIISTGDAATDKEIVDEMVRSYEGTGMSIEVAPVAGGGIKIILRPPQAPTTVATSGGQVFEMPKAGLYEPGGAEGYELKADVMAGNLAGIRRLLGETRAAQDWHDRSFMLDLVGKECVRAALDAACAAEPRAADLLLLRGTQALGQAWVQRGSGTADQITDQGAQGMRSAAETAARDFALAAEFDPSDPTPHACLIEVAMLHPGLSGDDSQRAFRQTLERDRVHVDAYARMIYACSERWGGARPEGVKVAQNALRDARPGSDLYAMPFRAHIEAFYYRRAFRGDEAAAMAILQDEGTRAEVNAAFDNWVVSGYKPLRASIPQLHWAAAWYFQIGDRARLKRAMAAIGMIQCRAPWHLVGEPSMMWGQAIQQSM